MFCGQGGDDVEPSFVACFTVTRQRLLSLCFVLVAIGLEGCQRHSIQQNRHKQGTTHVHVVETEFLGGEDLASVVTAASGEHLPPPYQRFHVSLDRTNSEDHLGIEFTEEFNSLFVSGLSQASLIGRWNVMHPTKEVIVGDRVVDVNGMHGHLANLAALIEQPSRLDLTILRVPVGSLSSPAPADFYEIMLDRTKGETFGVYCSISEQSLLIKGITRGLFADWNREMADTPELIVKPGDRIVSVNGAQGSGDALLKESNLEEVLEIRLLRGEGPTEIENVDEDSDAAADEQVGNKELTISTAATTSAPPTITTAAQLQTTANAPIASTSSRNKVFEEILSTSVAPPMIISERSVRGLKAEFFYHIDEDINLRPVTREKLETVFRREPDLVRIDANIDYPLTAYGFAGITERHNFAVRWTGKLLMREGGMYTFSLRSDDGSILVIDNDVVLGRHGHPDWEEHIWEEEPPHWLFLSAGEHDITVKYFNVLLEAGIILQYKGPDTHGHWDVVPSTSFRCPLSSLPDGVVNGVSFLKRFVFTPDAEGKGAPFYNTQIATCLLVLICAAVLFVSVACVSKMAPRHFREPMRHADLRGILEGRSARSAARETHTPILSAEDTELFN